MLERMNEHMGIDYPYLQSIDKLNERNKTFDVLEKDVIKRIRKYIREFPTVITYGAYYKCFLSLLADTGARIQEIMFIKKKNVNLDVKEIFLTQTKNKEDRISISVMLSESLQ
jgi:integrase